MVGADEATGPGLHGDHAHRVGEDVVQLAGDAQPLLGDGPPGLLLALSLQVGGALFELGDEQAPGAHVVAEQPAAGDDQDGVHSVGPAATVVATQEATAATINTSRDCRASSRVAAMYTMSGTAGEAIGGYWRAA